MTYHIDTRSITDGRDAVFVALSTPNNDGHRYIADAVAKGVKDFVVHAIPTEYASDTELNFTVVPDTLGYLQQLAADRRGLLNGTVIGITGSRGKTELKEILYQALAPAVKISRSPRSYNSQTGVPLSLLEAGDNDCVVIIEAGISTPGEMERLAPIIRPQIGVITNITTEHAGGFTCRKQQIAEKLALFADCPAIVYDDSDPELTRWVKEIYPGRTLIGAHGCRNQAQAVLSLLGQPAGLLDYTHPVRTRLNVIDGTNGCRIVFDRFTNDIRSLRGALDFMNRHTDGLKERILIIDSANALGDWSELPQLLHQYSITRAIVIGNGIPRFEHIEYVYDIDNIDADAPADAMVLIKGYGDSAAAELYNRLEAKQHETLLEVNLDALTANFNFFRSKVKPTTGVICMLKAAGYGAGSLELARTLQQQGAAYLAVAVVDEGVELRRAGITMPIIVLNPRAQNHRMMFDYRLEPEIYSLEILDEVVESARRSGVSRYPVHLKLETGMRRLGFTEAEIPRLAEHLNGTDRVAAATAFSHLACADDPAEDDYTRGQFRLFRNMTDALSAALPYPFKRHILNSTGIIRFPEEQYDFVRLGIGLYGVPTLADGSMDALRNVSTLSSVIISLKEWKKGDTVGYNRRGVLKADSLIATIPVGYADGIDRHLGYGNASFIVNGHPCPTVGSICMDICMIDVTGVDCRVGDRVEIFGDTVAPQILADKTGTIPYEILTSISPRVKRIYYKE